MSRINSIQLENAEGETKELLQGVNSKFGMVPNLVKVIANSPAALKAYVEINNALGGGTFDAVTREAIALTVAGANGCDYCASAHSAASKMMKVEATEIENRLSGSSDDAQLDTLLKFTRSIIETRGFVDTSEIQAVRDAGYSNEQITELLGHIVANIFTNYVNHVAETEIDFPKISAASYKLAA